MKNETRFTKKIQVLNRDGLSTYNLVYPKINL